MTIGLSGQLVVRRAMPTTSFTGGAATSALHSGANTAPIHGAFCAPCLTELVVSLKNTIVSP